MANESKKKYEIIQKHYKNLEKFTKKGDSPVKSLHYFYIKETFLEYWGVPSSNFKHFFVSDSIKVL